MLFRKGQMVRLVRCPEHRRQNTGKSGKYLIPGRVISFDLSDDSFGGHVTFSIPGDTSQTRYACCVKKVGVQYTINLCK